MKITGTYDRFHTPEAVEIAWERRQRMEDYYSGLLQEIDISDMNALLMLQ